MKIKDGILRIDSGKAAMGCYRDKDRSCGSDCPACEIGPLQIIPSVPFERRVHDVALHCLNREIENVEVIP